MMKTKKEGQKDNDEHFNWKIVLPALAAIIIFYFIASYAIEQYNLPKKIIVYCHFNTTVNDDVPRDQCGYMKIVSRNIDNINIRKFEKFGRCSERLERLPSCDGETYHYSKYRLKDLCKGKDCDKVDGVICNAFYINYHNESNPNRQEFEQNYFVKANLSSEKAMMEYFNKCNIKMEWPWQ